MHHNASPAVVTTDATQRLPRWVLLVLALVYILPGLIGRDAWKPIDGAALGVMQDLASGQSPWASPSLLGQAAPEAAWLPYWLGALAMQALPFIDPITAARVPLGLALALGFMATWYSTYTLARAPLAQPVPFAFGGQAKSVDYARAVADGGLLALVACLGLAHMGHESSPHAYAMAAVACLMLASARILLPRTHTQVLRWWAVWWGSALALMGSGYPGTALSLGLLTLGLMVLVAPALGERQTEAGLRAAQPHWMTSLSTVALVLSFFALAWPHDAPAADFTTPTHLWRWIKTAAWFSWPVWPLAAWAVWRWRRQWRSPHILLPALWMVALSLTAVTAQVPQRHMLLALPVLAPLAAFALPTLRRSSSALIDWVSLILFSVTGLVIWFYWLAMQTGMPGPAARAVARLLPGFQPSLSIGALLFAAALTVGWFWVVRWRSKAHRSALWKGLVLSAAGTTWCWALLMSLWLPVLNHGMGYGALAQSLQRLSATSPCLYTTALPQSLLAELVRVGSHPQPKAAGQVAESACLFWAVGEKADMNGAALEQWAEVASVWQLTNRSERVRVLKRLSP
jgi:4-amino-4-deoxy-L-arabinose transferase-like glycosyltransferase